MSDLDTLRAGLVEGRMLFAVAFTSAEVLAWELRQLYAGTWCGSGPPASRCSAPARTSRPARSRRTRTLSPGWSA